MVILANEEAHELFKKGEIKTSIYEIKMEGIGDLLDDPKTRQPLIENFGKMAVRTFIKEIFEVVRAYCRETGNTKKLTEQSWYQFARLIRNCLAHDHVFHFSDYDIGLLPISYRDSIITLEMDNKPLPLRNFNHNYALLLFEDMREFISSL